MYHSTGINVYFEVGNREIPEYGYPGGYNPPRDDTDDCRALIHIESGTKLTVAIELDDNFRFFRADGLKMTVAIGHKQQEPYALDDVQAWYIPKHKFEAAGVGVSQLHTWKSATSKGKLCSLRVPAHQAFRIQDAQNDNWKKTYNANRACVAVFVVRRSLSGETDNDRERFITDPPEAARATAAVEAHPIRWEWFEELRSENGEASVFEFRNIGHNDFQSMDLQLLDEVSDSSDSDDGSDISDEEEEEEDGKDEDEREEWEDEEVDISAKNTDPALRRSKRTRGPNHLYDEPYGGVSTSARTPRSKEQYLSHSSSVSSRPYPFTRSRTNARTISDQEGSNSRSSPSTTQTAVASGQASDNDINHSQNEATDTAHTPMPPTPDPTGTPIPAKEATPASPGNTVRAATEGGRLSEDRPRDVTREKKKRAKKDLEILRAEVELLKKERDYRNRFGESDEE